MLFRYVSIDFTEIGRDVIEMPLAVLQAIDMVYMAVCDEYGFRLQNISDGQSVNALGCEWKIITTPGHSPGSVCWYCESEKILFSGDSLFAGAIGRSDLYGGDYDSEIKSLMEKIITLDGDTKVYPGHGESTDISTERTSNPFLQPFNELSDDGSVDGISF